MKMGRYLIAAALLIAVAGCTSLNPSMNPPQPSRSPLNPTAEANPGGPQPLVSPLDAPTAAAPNGLAVVPFRLEKPVTEGAEVVKGRGPANVPIAIVDVTFMGQELGSGKIGPDGQFAVKVPALKAQDMIGVTLANLSGTGLKIEDFYAPGFRGDEATQVPQVGYFWDTTTVEPAR